MLALSHGVGSGIVGAGVKGEIDVGDNSEPVGRNPAPERVRIP